MHLGFNNTTINQAIPPCTIYDEQVRGLHIRITKTSKTFYLYYRTRERRARRPKLGDFGTLTIKQARSIASEMMARVAAGYDPVADWRAAQRAPTIEGICDRYLNDYALLKKPRSYDEDKRLIEKIIKPKLGRHKTHALTHQDVEDLHKSLKDTPTQANRVVACLSRMMSLAEKWELRSAGTNPCKHVARFKENRRVRYMTPDEAARITEVLKKYEATRPEAVAFLHLVALSGARPDEISRAKREWIERAGDAGVLRLPDAKTGARPVYLPPQAMRLIDQLPETSTGRLFHIKSPAALWKLVRVEAGVPDLRLYDLRHTFASIALQAGFSLDQIGELLGHRSTQTTKRYAHLVEGKAHEAAAKTAALLEQMMQPTNTTSPAGQ